MDHDAFIRGYAIALFHQNYSYRLISSEMEKNAGIKVGKTSIGEWVTRYKEENHVDVLRKDNCGQKHAIGLDTGQKMVMEIE
jgi:transposase-like protein